MRAAPAIPEVSLRLERTRALGEAVSRLPYVSGARAEAFARRGVATVEDLLYRIPHRYLDFSHAYRIEEAPLGSTVTVAATVDRVQGRRSRSGIHVIEVSVTDETGVLIATFFKQPWIAQQVRPGDRLALMGKVEFSYGFKRMTAPSYEKLDDAAGAGAILPVHYVTEGISVAWWRRIVATALAQAGGVLDPLPARLRARRGLMSRARALRSAHFPAEMGEAELARRRLAYEEVLLLQLALRLRNDANLLDVPAVAHVQGAHVAALRAALPFALTDEQEACVADIFRDMADGGRVMNRLVLGDVGTGKTAVAAFALASAADTGTQACVMAPTSVLAQQYAVKLGPVLERAGVSWALLTGATPAAERADVTARLAAGSLTVLFGTHAVLSEDVAFKRLTLAVIDEQHRFGVHQRAELRAKGPGADLLVMTATPIPRTLALTVYGDLDTSYIRTRPVAGAGVATKVLTEANRDVAYTAMREALAAGQQAYVICPLVEPTDSAEELEDVPGVARDDATGDESPVRLRAVSEEVGRLARLFPETQVAALSGHMPAAEKDRVIEAFRAGETGVLVSTTVVEVGVDVPNATVMLIENGDRFGLATLHQLRGRVGRGSVGGRCYIVTFARKNGRPSAAQERLEALERTSDGFELAETDLRLRHEGEILGYRQHGGVSLRFVDLEADAQLIEDARSDALELLRYARALDAPALAPLRLEVVHRYGDVFKEVSGG